MEAVAAWVAAGLAAWIATARIREGRQQLRREAIAELDVRSTEWGIAAGSFIRGIMWHLSGTVDANEVNGPLLSGLSTATANITRALRVAEMVCPHKQIHVELDRIQATLREFMGLVAPSGPVGDGDARRRFLQRAVDEGQAVVLQLTEQSAAVVYVGMRRYSIRPCAPKRWLAKELEIPERDRVPEG